MNLKPGPPDVPSPKGLAGGGALERVTHPQGDGDGQSPSLLQNRFTHQKKKKLKKNHIIIIS